MRYRFNLCFLADCAPLGLFRTRPREGSLITVIMLPEHWTPLVKMMLNYYMCLQETSLKTSIDPYCSSYFIEIYLILAMFYVLLSQEINENHFIYLTETENKVNRLILRLYVLQC